MRKPSTVRLAACLLASAVLSSGAPVFASGQGGGENAGNGKEAAAEKPESRKIEETPEQKAEHEKRRVARLLDNLGDENYELVEQSVYAFELMGGKSVPPLLERMKSDRDNERLQVNIIYTLGRIGEKAKEAMPAVMPLLRHGNPVYRGVTAIALGRIGDGSGPVISGLEQLTGDGDLWVSSMAQEALDKIAARKKATAMENN